jgi:hypothetical protein
MSPEHPLTLKRQFTERTGQMTGAVLEPCLAACPACGEEQHISEVSTPDTGSPCCLLECAECGMRWTP